MHNDVGCFVWNFVCEGDYVASFGDWSGSIRGGVWLVVVVVLATTRWLFLEGLSWCVLDSYFLVCFWPVCENFAMSPYGCDPEKIVGRIQFA